VKIVVIASAGLDLEPPIAGKLRRIPPEKLHHARLRRRHPAGLYHISLGRVADRIEAVLAALEPLKPPFEGGGEPPGLASIMEATEALLYATMEHLENCDSLLLSLFPSNDSAKADRALKQFRREIKIYRDRVAMIVNAVKHSAGRIRPVLMYSDEAFAVGYFVEGVIEDKVIGPDPNIHNGGDTAISIFRDLKLHFSHLFFVGAALEKAVAAISGQELSPKSETAEDRKHEFRLRELARRISLLPEIVFPDELAMPFPLIRLRQADNFRSEAEFSFNPQSHGVRTFGKFRMIASWGGDSVTRTFKVPYLRPGWQRDLGKHKRAK
jgi:hypothetical protein